MPRESSFAPIAVPVSNGVANVQIKGTIETGQTPEGDARLYFTANRSATLVPTTQPARDSSATSEASTKLAVGARARPDPVVRTAALPARRPDPC